MDTTCPRRLRSLAPLVLCLLASLLGGCAALTNPVADGVPVRHVPPELLAESKDCMREIPLALLGQAHSDVYRLAPGDELGIWIEGVLGDRAAPLPIYPPSINLGREQRRSPTSVGYPVRVRSNGTIRLPQIDPLPVAGLTLSELEDAIRDAYTRPRRILQEGNERILVTLLQPRHSHVVVFRQETSTFTPALQGGLLSAGKRGTGFAIDLPAYENDLLHALAATGGLPGLDVCDQVVIERACPCLDPLGHPRQTPADKSVRPDKCSRVVIPLRMRPCDPLPFGPQDVLLHDGDVVFLEARIQDVYYTGGLMPATVQVLPRDRDLDVIHAIAEVRGPLINGAFLNNNLAGNVINTGIGFDSPALVTVVRRLPTGGTLPIRVDLNRALRDPRERILVCPGDVLILQEMPNAAMARYFGTTLFNFSLAWRGIHSNFVQGVFDFSAPQQLAGRIGIAQFIPSPP